MPFAEHIADKLQQIEELCGVQLPYRHSERSGIWRRRFPYAAAGITGTFFAGSDPSVLIRRRMERKPYNLGEVGANGVEQRDKQGTARLLWLAASIHVGLAFR